MVFRTLCFILTLLCHSIAFGAEQPTEENPVTFELFLENQEIQADRPFTVAIQMHVAKGWHSYWKNPGDSGMPIQIHWDLPEGFVVGETQWPLPQRFEVNEMIGYGYEGDATFLTKITPPKNLNLAGAPPLKLSLEWLVCSDSMCLPGDQDVSLTLTNAATSTPEFFSNARALIPQKNPTLSAKRHQDFIEIQWEGTTSFTQATFYPESKKVVDETTSPTLNAQSLMVKIEPSGEFPTSLAGVLHLQKDGTSEIWDVNLSLENSQDASLIGLADLDKPAIAQQAINDDAISLPLAFLFAFVGGLLLNLMPCVLPVISLKILSFVKMAGQNRRTTLYHGLAFFCGVIASFWVLAGAMLLLQSYGHAVGWGFQLQEPFFVGLLSALLLLFALSFFGVFELGTSLTSLAGQAQPTKANSALFGSFCSGILATAVATPCSGPFLGSAIGFAFTLPPILALAIFTVLGIGMALPYVLLSAFPSLLRFLPKPGAWMITFKEMMGFAMLTTVLWLLWVFGAQTGNIPLFILLFALLVISFAAWIYGHFCSIVCGKTSQIVGTIVSLVLVAGSLYAIHTASSSSLIELDQSSTEAIANADIDWEAFSPARVEELKEQGTPILIDFTAKWCLICQVNHLVLCNAEVTQKMREKNVVKMKADWTRKDATITQALQAFGRNAVPLYVLIKRDGTEAHEILPQVLTTEIVIDHLNRL
ncbi:MAG: protein-disulfide reductase DsbD family protein [Parachlamydiaceae bacterium]